MCQGHCQPLYVQYLNPMPPKPNVAHAIITSPLQLRKLKPRRLNDFPQAIVQ